MAMTELPLLQPEGRVLSTLDSDGSRRWLHPRLATGKHWRRRRLVAYALIAVYTLLPFITIYGRPAVQLDIWNREFALFGLTFLPTDTLLLALFGVTVGVSIFFATALMGRVWCGWACPQTVYLEFVYRPVERLFYGTTGKGGVPKRGVAGWRAVAMYLVYFLISLHLANTFLSYFVGVQALNDWIWTSPPWKHPAAFAVVMFVTGAMMFDFCYWREQLCIVGCPYGRFQSVMLDRSSAIVGYDRKRGEPRGKGRDRAQAGLGDCVDCSLCVAVCPTGIDIRDGLQLECVNCTQCIDACDAVMDRVGRPRGLIRYSSQSALDREPTKLVRPRVIVYSLVIVGLVTVLAVLLSTRKAFDLTLLRGLGSPFVIAPSGEVDNLVRVKLVNRTAEPRTYTVEAVSPKGIRVSVIESVRLEPLAMGTEPVHLMAPAELFRASGGALTVRLRVTDDTGAVRERDYLLYGPAAPAAKGSANQGTTP
jgi:cytochrome c oxidase accessory protein FixG